MKKPSTDPSAKVSSFPPAAAAIAAQIEADAAARHPRSVDKAAAAAAGRAAAAMAYNPTEYKKTPVLVSLPDFSRCLTGFSATGGGPTMTEGTFAFTSLEKDPYYLRGPNCVICTDREQSDRRYGINRNLAGGWLHWRALRAPHH